MIEEFTDEYLERLKSSFNADENPVKYLGIDPGSSNGVCGYDAKYYLLFAKTVPANDFTKFLEIFEKVNVCVIENFKLFPNKAKQQIYSDMETSRMIGRVEAWAERRDVRLVNQPSSIKPNAYAWIGQKPLPKSNPLNHQQDANAHFMFWAIKNGRIDMRQLVNKPKGP